MFAPWEDILASMKIYIKSQFQTGSIEQWEITRTYSSPLPLPPLSFPSFEMTQPTRKKNEELSHAMSAHCLKRYNKYISLTSLKINPCSRPAQWSLKHLSHMEVSYKQRLLLKWPPLALLNPPNNCLLFEQHDGVLPLMSTHNELLCTHAVIIRSIIISHIYIACFHLSETQGILHIILLIIK